MGWAGSQERGIFVVLEGVDRSGKSTQCQLLVQSLRALRRTAELVRFPDRSTEIGGLIDKYLKRDVDLDDRAVHLLFSANRWEKAEAIAAALARGTDVVCDRYAYSGVAFSAAKASIDDIAWCKAPDRGLPQPDLVIFLDLNRDKAERRGGFGGERYEVTDMQARVAENFAKLRREAPERWVVVDAGRDVDAVGQDILQSVQRAIDAKPADIASLW